MERVRAERISVAVDRIICEPDGQVAHLDPEDADVLAMARRLARLPTLLGSVEPALEQQVMRRVRLRGSQPRGATCFKPGWVVVGVVVVLLVLMLLTPLGDTAVASFMAVFRLGRTEVRITPVDTPSALRATVTAESNAIQHSLTLEEAQSQVSFLIPQPGYLPSGYLLRRVKSYTYPDLPAWVPQPLFIELVYEDDSGRECILRLYPIVLGNDASISGMDLEAAPIHHVEDVEVNGRPGVLLHLGTERTGSLWQELVWEQNDLILALSATHLTEEQLLHVACSVH